MKNKGTRCNTMQSHTGYDTDKQHWKNYRREEKMFPVRKMVMGILRRRYICVREWEVELIYALYLSSPQRKWRL